MYAGPRDASDSMQDRYSSVLWMSLAWDWFPAALLKEPVIYSFTCSLFFKRAEALVGYFGFF
ncbi:unnamed protein product [Prunus armeniaca]